MSLLNPARHGWGGDGNHFTATEYPDGVAARVAPPRLQFVFRELVSSESASRTRYTAVMITFPRAMSPPRGLGGRSPFIHVRHGDLSLVTTTSSPGDLAR